MGSTTCPTGESPGTPAPPTTDRAELYRPDGRGDMALLDPQADGSIHCEVLDVRLSTVAGPRLRITCDTGTADL